MTNDRISSVDTILFRISYIERSNFEMTDLVAPVSNLMANDELCPMIGTPKNPFLRYMVILVDCIDFTLRNAYQNHSIIFLGIFDHLGCS